MSRRYFLIELETSSIKYGPYSTKAAVLELGPERGERLLETEGDPSELTFGYGQSDVVALAVALEAVPR